MDTNNKRKSMAKKRWKLLSQTLSHSKNEVNNKNEISLVRFVSFGLIKSVFINDNSNNNKLNDWYKYTCDINNDIFIVEICKINKILTANDLIGFNNTGNICVWPSEECLAFYLLNNQNICRNKKVLELGGGMSCLAGIFVAKYCQPMEITLTDGNVISVENVKSIIARNNMDNLAKCQVLQWSEAADAFRNSINNNKNGDLQQIENLKSNNNCLYDVILSGDCLFFDDVRVDLVETIYGWLADDGIALIIAPKRGLTFDKFIETAIKRGFLTRQIENYNSQIWSKHLELLENNHLYEADQHYPILIELTKQPK